MNGTPPRHLFTPLTLGPMQLKHRVIMAPLTRSRAVQPEHIPGDLMLEYYTQRVSDGGFIISEANQMSIASRGWHGAPGLYSDAQVEGWKKIVDAVHEKGGQMFAQLWHPGRFSHTELTGGPTPVSASVDPSYWQEPSRMISTSHGWLQPSPHRALEVSEMDGVIELYANAVIRAKAAGFDGVEVHAGNGYLLDQFLQDSSNKRNDEYGGSIENRCRLLFEVVEAITSAWESNRIAIRITPGGTFNAMSDSDPIALSSHIAEGLNQFGLAYLHIIEPRVSGYFVAKEGLAPVASERLRKIFKGTIVANGGFEPESAETAVAAGVVDAVAFGRYFISNPDLPKRIHEGFPLAKYDHDTFYTFDAKGYTDYLPYSELVTA